ncbi:unnamed protein product [Effrenium voratum]|nr:unnamed protein product [Effrenium voratum]
MNPELSVVGETAGASGPGSHTSARARSRAYATCAWLEANSVKDSVALVSDEAMLLHLGPSNHPERPARLAEILHQLEISGLRAACANVPSRKVTRDELLTAHTEKHVDHVFASASVKKKGKDYGLPFGPDTYVNEQSPDCAALSAGCLLALVDHCMADENIATCGMACVRPPGHHASQEKACGFCLFNNVAVAVRHAQKQYGLQRVAVVDWDVHHGNGTNDIFAEDDSVLFFSLHRYGSTFFPGTGFAEDVGKSSARGFNVNVPLDKGFGDLDVRHIMQYLICPLMEKFEPEAIFVSAGFDAVRGDPLGDCRVTPEGFGWMTRCLYRLARHFCQGRLFLSLEGGYNPDMIAQCTVECVRSMLQEVNDLAGPEMELVPATPCSSHPGTPASMPASPSWSSSLDEASRASRASTPISGTPPASPALSAGRKACGPAGKTVRAVRKATELLQVLPMDVPLAPVGEGASKSAKKNERRKQRKNSAEEDGASSDSSGWAIACGTDAEFAFSPAMRGRQRSSSHDHDLPELELPPPMPEAVAVVDPEVKAPEESGQAKSKQKKKSKRK